MSDISSKFKEPFSLNDLEWRVQTSGISKKNETPWAIIVPYVSARAVQDRLDDVVGSENWQCSFREWSTKAQICTISIWSNSQWISKEDGAENTDI